MGVETVFWIVEVVCAAWALRAWRQPGTSARGWLVIHAVIALVALAGRLAAAPSLVWTAAGLWVVFVWVPSLLARLGTRLASRRQYDAARRLATIAGRLHPFDGWPEASTFIGALALAERGDPDGAVALLEPLCRPGSPFEEKAVVQRARVTQRWEEIRDWATAHPERLAADAELLGLAIRALGETGDVAGMTQLFERHRDRIAGLPQGALRDSIRLVLFALTGQPGATGRHLATAYAASPPDTHAYWMGTARLAAGETDAARDLFERTYPTAGAGVQGAIRRRLERIDRPCPPLDERSRRVVDAEASRTEEESRYASRVSIWSPGAIVTRCLVAANVVAFVLETAVGESTDFATLHRLGGLCTECVADGAWWRLVTSTFLHLGILHLSMNVLALSALGPAAETGLGRRRFLAIYLLSGAGSMAAVAARAWATGTASFTIGASGSVMGIIGSSAAMMLRGWLRERAPVARSRGLAMGGYVLLQAVIDSFVPQFSFTGHLAGAVIGFVATLLLGDRLHRGVAPPPRDAAPRPSAG